MTFTEWALLAVLSIAAALMAYGVLLIYIPAGFIVAGVLLVVIAVLFLFEAGSHS